MCRTRVCCCASCAATASYGARSAGASCRHVSITTRARSVNSTCRTLDAYCLQGAGGNLLAINSQGCEAALYLWVLAMVLIILHYLTPQWPHVTI